MLHTFGTMVRLQGFETAINSSLTLAAVFAFVARCGYPRSHQAQIMGTIRQHLIKSKVSLKGLHWSSIFSSKFRFFILKFSAVIQRVPKLSSRIVFSSPYEVCKMSKYQSRTAPRVLFNSYVALFAKAKTSQYGCALGTKRETKLNGFVDSRRAAKFIAIF